MTGRTKVATTAAVDDSFDVVVSPAEGKRCGARRCRGAALVTVTVDTVRPEHHHCPRHWAKREATLREHGHTLTHHWPEVIPDPDHVDADGLWWECGQHWWARVLPGGTLQARHRTRPRTPARPDGIADVILPPDASGEPQTAVLSAMLYSTQAVRGTS